MININFITNDGAEVSVNTEEGKTLLEVAHENGIQISSPCEGNLACGQCHVIIDDKFFSKLEAPSEREQDILDFLPNGEANSRLACQIKITKDLDGMKVKVASF